MPNKNNNGTLRTLRKWAVNLRRLLRSSRGKDFLIFCSFLGVSYVFWVIMTLNDDIQQDVKVNLEIANTPSNYTFITEPPHFLQVSLRDKGTILANYSISGGKTLKINYSDFAYDEQNDRITLTEQQLNSRLRALFDPTTQIITVRPDSLSFIVTDRAPNLARVIPEVNATPASQYVISGPITVSPDTVKVYSARHLRIRPATVKTAKVTRTELKDSLVVEVRIQSEPGTRIEPSTVKVTVPIEPLITKSREVAIQLTRTPDNTNVVTFPSRVRVSYLVPMSLYNSETNVVTVTADFAQRNNGKIPLTIGALPDYYRGADLSVDSVEYIIERKSDY
ncbi:MAG: YbbR-like domain-containing protein [Bacteroides sp.]|nr:YbbR-like domain-containing protein [Bacteroides sp.]MCM1378707.1 YbbR-like domain-containing protein [Bacteroides sp.]MCM1444980.1 YbbR-like domain-containing protein [Prevotella sp.]